MRNSARRLTHDRHEVEEASSPGGVGTIRTPGLVGPVDRQIPQQIGIFPVLKMRHCCAGLLVDCPRRHLWHEPAGSFAANFVVQTPKITRHLR